VVRLAKATGIGERYSPARVSRRRRESWPSAEAAYEHFAAKPAFARWAPGVLRDYIACGTEEHADDGASVQRLAFARDVETAIYRSLPDHIARLLRTHPLRVPAAFVRGSRSEEVRRVGLAATRRLTHGRISTVEGSHLFPFERPAETAAEVLRWIDAMAAPA
jgi:pimeloyl-ACP methyl ester carboxylesterase